MSSIKVPVSNQRNMEVWELTPGFRTQAQFDKVKEIVESEDFDFSCGSLMFHLSDLDGPSTYKGPVSFTYFTKDGMLHCQRISANGRVLKHVTPIIKLEL